MTVSQPNAMPPIHARNFQDDPDFANSWLRKGNLRASGRTFLSDRYWALEAYDMPKTAQLCRTLSRLITANTLEIPAFHTVGACYMDGQAYFGGRQPQYAMFIAMSTQVDAYLHDKEIVFEGLTEATNKDLEIMGSSLRLPLQ